MNPERTGIKITDHRKYGGFGENRKNGALGVLSSLEE